MIGLNKPVQALLALMALGLVSSLIWGFISQGRVNVLQEHNKAATEQVQALEGTVQQLQGAILYHNSTNVAQSAARAKARVGVQATLTQLRREELDAPEPRPTASPTQLDRLRRLVEASNYAAQVNTE